MQNFTGYFKPLWSLLATYFLVTLLWSLFILYYQKKTLYIDYAVYRRFKKINRRIVKMINIILSTVIGMVGTGALGRGSI